MNRAARLHDVLPRWLLRPVENRFLWQRAIHTLGQTTPGWQAIALNDAKGERVDLQGSSFLAQVKQNAVTTCSGWEYASWPLVAAHQQELRRLFAPSPDYAAPPQDFITSVRGAYDVLVGVLIRQSDYREWMGGKYCFATTQYVQWMRQVMDLHPGRRVGFVVAADERQDPALFAGLPFHFTSGAVNTGGPWFRSWVELSLCDFVLSPPSTFSATASFVGGRPLWPLSDLAQTLNFDQMLPNGLLGAAAHPAFSCAVK